MYGGIREERYSKKEEHPADGLVPNNTGRTNHFRNHMRSELSCVVNLHRPRDSNGVRKLHFVFMLAAEL